MFSEGYITYFKLYIVQIIIKLNMYILLFLLSKLTIFMKIIINYYKLIYLSIFRDLSNP